MEKILRGVVHGNRIDLLESLDLADGTSVRVLVTPAMLPPSPPGLRKESPVSVGGILADVWTEEDDRIFEEIYQDRKRTSRRDLPDELPPER